MFRQRLPLFSGHYAYQRDHPNCPRGTGAIAGWASTDGAVTIRIMMRRDVSHNAANSTPPTQASTGFWPPLLDTPCRSTSSVEGVMVEQNAAAALRMVERAIVPKKGRTNYELERVHST